MKKAKKGGKDPNKPKRPASAFFVFLEDFRKTYKETHPDNKSVAAVGKASGEKWKSLSDTEKAPYVQKAEERKKEYETTMAAYHRQCRSIARHVDEENDSDSDSEQSQSDDDGDDDGDEDGDDIPKEAGESGSSSDVVILEVNRGKAKTYHSEGLSTLVPKKKRKKDDSWQSHGPCPVGPFDPSVIPSLGTVYNDPSKTGMALAHSVLQAYSFESAEEIGMYFLNNRGNTLKMVTQLLTRGGGGGGGGAQSRSGREGSVQPGP